MRTKENILTQKCNEIVGFIQETYKTKEFIPLHEPRFLGNEKRYLNECIDSTFVSSVGKFVERLEEDFADYVGAKYAVATVNGTSALHIALLCVGVEKDDEVLTQALSFVATANAISYCGAESLGSYYKTKHTGRFGSMGCFSFNGNKIITAGGGGIIVTDDANLAQKAKHLSTTAKVPHKREYVHDMLGYNYRMPNLNAALLVAQLEELEGFLEKKRLLAKRYNDFFAKFDDIAFIKEPKDAKSNYWLNALAFPNREQRDDLKNSYALCERVVNIPSSVVL
jgi:dTDP-4-amino-4,6-dideoxygalactose transaminase